MEDMEGLASQKASLIKPGAFKWTFEQKQQASHKILHDLHAKLHVLHGIPTF